MIPKKKLFAFFLHKLFIQFQFRRSMLKDFLAGDEDPLRICFVSVFHAGAIDYTV